MIHKRRQLPISTIAILLALLLGSCGTQAPQLSTPEPTSSTTPIPTATQEATLENPVIESVPSNTWLVETIAIDQSTLEMQISGARWLDERYLRLGGVPHSYWFDTEVEEYVDGDALGLAITPSLPRRTSLVHDLRCTDDGLELYRIEDTNSIAAIKIEIEDCVIGESPNTRVSQTMDTSAISFIIDGNVYVWETDGSVPRIVGITTFSWSAAAWSPDGTRLVVREASASGSLDWHTFNILYRDGRPMLVTGAVIGTRTESSPNWFTNDIIVDGVQCGASCNESYYYDADSGEYLTGHIYEGYYVYDQGMVRSPDERWLFNDITSMRGFSLSAFAYVIYNLEEQTERNLPINQLIEFLWWDEESESITFLTQPFVDDPDNANKAYGLMSYSLENDETRLLLPNAVHIAAAKDQGKYLAALLDGTLHDLNGLNIALFDENNERISEELFYAEQMVFSDAYKGFINPGVWSNDGSKVIFTNEHGEFWLMNDNGDATQLSEGNAIEKWPYGIKVVWSPEGSQAVIMYNDQVWLVRIPEN